MERKVFLFGLLQSLLLFASADPDHNETSLDNGIETDVASIEESLRTLPMVESPPRNAAVNSDQLQENLLPFGALKSDWTRLYLLRDALPRDSIVKQKFKHLFRLLLVAYDQATRFSFTSESTKSQDTSESGTTVSVSTSKEGNVQKIDEKQPTTEDEPLLTSTRTTLIELPTTASLVELDQDTSSISASISNPIRPLLNYTEDDVDSVTMKNISQHSTGRDDEEKSTMRTDIPDTRSTGGGIEPSTLFDINGGSSTETVLKETFDQPTTRKEYVFQETSPKTMTTMDGQSLRSTPSERGLERTQEKADGTFLHQSSTKTVPAEETSIVNEYILAATVSTSVSSRSHPSYSSSRENLAMSTKAENNVGSPELVTTDPKERYSTYEDYSSAATTLSYDTTEGTSFTSNRTEQLLLSTTDQNRLIELKPATTSEKNKSPLAVINMPSPVAEGEELLSSKTQSQSTWEVKLSSEGASSSIEEFSTTLSAAELYMETNVWLTKNSTESSSIDKERKNEEIKPEKDTEFVTSGKLTGNKQDIWGSTPRSNVSSGSSTGSTNTRHHIHERSTTVTVAETSDLPKQGQHVNKSDALKDELVTEKNTVDERVQHNTGSTTEEKTGSRKATDKPNYIKNPLPAGSSRSNDIFRDFKHRPENGTDRSSESERMILYESGGSVKSGNVWRPHLVRVTPVGNNIRRFDKAPANARTYGYQRPSPSAVAMANSRGEPPVRSNKGPFPSRTNLLMPRKRGSANADIEKLFRWFYTRGQIEPSNQSRSNENDNTKITIQCKKTQ